MEFPPRDPPKPDHAPDHGRKRAAYHYDEGRRSCAVHHDPLLHQGRTCRHPEFDVAHYRIEELGFVQHHAVPVAHLVFPVLLPINWRRIAGRAAPLRASKPEESEAIGFGSVMFIAPKSV